MKSIDLRKIPIIILQAEKHLINMAILYIANVLYPAVFQTANEQVTGEKEFPWIYRNRI